MEEAETFNILGIKYFDKGYEKVSYSELVEAPVSAIRGVSETDLDDLKKSLRVKTVGDLANNKYVQIAQALHAFSSISTKILDKSFESEEFENLGRLPVDAISGISKRGSKMLKRSLGIDTIEELAENRYVKIAQIVDTMATLESIL